MQDGSFKLSLGFFRKKVVGPEGAYNRFKRGVAIKLFTAVIRDTPVDTGRLRANWRCSIASPDLSTSDDKDKGGGATIAAMQGTVLGSQAEDELWLSNSLPYVSFIEYGGSREKSPRGMVRRNVARFQELVKKQLANLGQ